MSNKLYGEVTLSPGDRVFGPYQHRKQWRLVIRRAAREGAPPTKDEHLNFVTPDDARKVMARLLAGTDDTLTVADAIERFIVETKVELERRKATQTNTRNGLRRFFNIKPDNALGAMPVQMLTPAYCKKLFTEQRMSWSPDTSHGSLHCARTFARWCIASKLLREDPVAELKEPRKKTKHGKTVLTIDESRALTLYCVNLAHEALKGEDPRRDMERLQRATATLLCLLLGVRAGEVVGRLVRDIDDRGTVLRIVPYVDMGIFLKTDHSARSLRLPAMIQPLVAGLAKGKRPMEPLFDAVEGRGKKGKERKPGRKNARWVHRAVTELCAAAGVTVTCPHGLRHTQITHARAAGNSANLVMAAMGFTGPTGPGGSTPSPAGAMIDVSQMVMMDSGHNNMAQQDNYTQPDVLHNKGVAMAEALFAA